MEDHDGWSTLSERIVEDLEPGSPITVRRVSTGQGHSILANMLRKSPPEQLEEIGAPLSPHSSRETRRSWSTAHTDTPFLTLPQPELGQTESSPLLIETPESVSQNRTGDYIDVEGQKDTWKGGWLDGISKATLWFGKGVADTARVVLRPNTWDRGTIWKNVVLAPVSCLPAVTVGVLLNILDALSYGEHSISMTLLASSLTSQE